MASSHRHLRQLKTMTREELESLDEEKVKNALQKVFASKGFKVFIGSKSLRFENDGNVLCWKAEPFYNAEDHLLVFDWRCYNLAFTSHEAVVDAIVSSDNDKTWKSLALKIEEHLGDILLIDDWIHTIKPLQMPKTIEEILIEGDLL